MRQKDYTGCRKGHLVCLLGEKWERINSRVQSRKDLRESFRALKIHPQGKESTQMLHVEKSGHRSVRHPSTAAGSVRRTTSGEWEWKGGTGLQARGGLPRSAGLPKDHRTPGRHGSGEALSS